METQDNKQQTNTDAKNKRTDFFEKREMNQDITDADNKGDNSFTPIYLDDDNVLQTPEEKQHDEKLNAQQNDKLEARDMDAEETTMDKVNNNAMKNGMNG